MGTGRQSSTCRLCVCLCVSIYLYLGVFATHTLYVDYPCLRLAVHTHICSPLLPPASASVSVPVPLCMSTRLCSDCVKCLQLWARGIEGDPEDRRKKEDPRG